MSRNRLTQRRRWLFLLLGVLLTLTTRARAVEVQTTTTTSAKQQRHTQADGSSTSSSSMNPQKSTVLTPESIHQNVYHSFWTRMGAEKEEETGKLNDNFLRLLSTTSDEEKQSFSFTWRDWIGLVVWFCAAGVATSCGVGGGGIYVPLGILWLMLPPKSASGLSQASIFGASLGGLLLNLRFQHPQTTTTSTSSQSNNSRQFSRPLIDYDMALFLAPLEMAGAVLGVLVQSIFPDWLYLSVASIVLGFTSYKTFGKYQQVRQQEPASTPAIVMEDSSGDHPSSVIRTMSDPLLRIGPTGSHEPQEQAAAEELLKEQELPPQPHQDDDNHTDAAVIIGPTKSSHDEEHHHHSEESSSFKEQEMMPPQPQEYHQDSHNQDNALRHRSHSNEPPASRTTLPSGGDIHETTTEDTHTSSSENHQEEQCRSFLERDSRQYPTEKFIALAILWLGLSFVTLLKGGKGVESLAGIDCTSPWYGVLIGVQFLWTLGFSAVSGRKLVQEYAKKQQCGYPFHVTDISWTYEKMKIYAAGTFVAGIVAGLIGIGGGMVLGPLMIFMGVHPQVSTATTATMIVLTSSSVAVVFITSGMVPLYYALAFFTSCFCGALVGKQYIDGYVKRTGKASLLIFLLATIIALATIGCMVIVVLKLSEANWHFDGLQTFCNK